MASLRLFEPTVTDPLDIMFRRFLTPMRSDRSADELSIRVDVMEKNGAFQVRADLPGVKKEDINVRIDGNIVQIDAESKQEKDIKDEGGKLLRSERYCGSVSRTFSLAQDVDETKAVAKYEDGVLTLDLPKKTTTASKRLAIN